MPVDWTSAGLITLGLTTLFGAGGVVYMAKDTKKRCEKLEDEKVDCEDCEQKHKGVCKKLDDINVDTKENTKLLHEIVGELKHLNGRK